MRNTRQAVFRQPLQRGLIGHGETVDADAQHQWNLVDQHVADGAQLFAVTQALPQQRGMAEGTTIVEGRKGNRL